MASNESDKNDTQRTFDVSPDDLEFVLRAGLKPRDVLGILFPGIQIPPNHDEELLLRMILGSHGVHKREKLTQYNTIDDAVELIKNSKNIIVLSGAGISTSAGLPDFRSRNGIYRQIHQIHPDLRDPKLMFDIKYFRKNPLPFYHFAKALYPGQYEPTVSHKFIKCIEDHGKLLNNYTQNIDTLEKLAGIKRVIECHGSFSKASCTSCKHTLDGESLKKDIFDRKVPICPLCHSKDDGPEDGLGIMKPNIVFFGEQLGVNFHDTIEADKNIADLLIVVGSSLKVKPVALLPNMIPDNVPQIVINREPLDNFNFDIELYGNCDEIVQEICFRLGNGWSSVCPSKRRRLTELVGPEEVKLHSSSNVGSMNKDSNITYPGASKLNENDASKSTNADNASTCDKVGQEKTSDDEHSSDWEDCSTERSTDDDLYDKLDFDVPNGAYVFLEPCMYIFNGTEMTRAQYRKKIQHK